MGSYGQYCPVAHAAEILTERWTPLIVRELLAGINHFNALERSLPGIPRALLARRLRTLQEAGIIDRRLDNGRSPSYQLTQGGRELQHVVDALGSWGVRWAFEEPRREELDPGLLLWWMQRRVALDNLPRRRLVVEFEFRGVRIGRYWLVLRRDDVSVCLHYPGFTPDIRVAADIAEFYKVWLGRISLAEAVRAGRVRLEGLPALVRAFPNWFTWSPMASLVRARRAEVSYKDRVRSHRPQRLRDRTSP